MIKDNYHTIEEAHFEELREKASKFLAFAFSVYNQNDIQEKLETLKIKRGEDREKLREYEKNKIQIQQVIYKYLRRNFCYS